MICEKCGKKHDGSFGSGRFCSRSCANSRVWTDEINQKRSNTIKQGVKDGRIIPQKPQLGKPIPEEQKIKISESMKRVWKQNPNLVDVSKITGENNPTKRKDVKDKLRKSALKSEFWKYKRKHNIRYNGYKFDSSYEVEVVKSLDVSGIKWEKPKSFKYIFNSIEHTYTPDIYLPDYDVYLDPKNDFLIENINPGTGYKDTDKIKSVCEQNNIKILILDKKHLTWDKILELINSL